MHKMGDLTQQLVSILGLANALCESITVNEVKESLGVFQHLLKEMLQHLNQSPSLAQWLYNSAFNPALLQKWLRKQEIEGKAIDHLVRNFVDSGVEIRDASNALQATSQTITSVLCFFYKGTDYADPFLESLNSCLIQQSIPLVTTTSVYEDSDQVQMLFEYQRIFLHYSKSQGNRAIKYVAAGAAALDGVCAIMLSEAGGLSTQAFVPPGEPTNVQLQGSPDGVFIEVYWNGPAVGGNYVNGFLVWFRADSDLTENWQYVTVESSPARISLLVPRQRQHFKVSATSRLGVGPFSPTVSWSVPIPQTQQLPSYPRVSPSPFGQHPHLKHDRSNGFTQETAMPDRQDEKQFQVERSMSPKAPGSPAEYLKQKGTLIRPGRPSLYRIQAVDVMRDSESETSKCKIPFELVHEDKEDKVIILLGATGAGKSTLVNACVNHFYGVEWEDPFRLILIPDSESGKPKAESQTSWITAYTFPWQVGCRAPYNLTIVDTPGFGDTKGLMGDKNITNQLQKFFTKSKPEGLDHLDGIGFVLQASNARLTPTEKYIIDSILSAFGKDVVNNIYLMITFADSKIPPVLGAIKEGQIPFVDFFRFNNSALFSSPNASDSEDSRFDAMFWKLGRRSFSNFFVKFQESKSVSISLSKQVLKERQALEATIQGIQTRIQDALNILSTIKYETAILEQRKAEVNTNKHFSYQAQVTKQRRVALKRDNLIRASRQKYVETQLEMMDLLRDAHKKLCILDEIALKPNPMTITDYIDLLISSENYQMRPGCMDRVRILQEIRESAEMKTIGKEGSRNRGKGDDSRKSSDFSAHKDVGLNQNILKDDDSLEEDPQDRQGERAL
ncbi:unnamed protein product, partial [Darwinula stevensoni]